MKSAWWFINVCTYIRHYTGRYMYIYKYIFFSEKYTCGNRSFDWFWNLLHFAINILHRMPLQCLCHIKCTPIYWKRQKCMSNIIYFSCRCNARSTRENRTKCLIKCDWLVVYICVQQVICCECESDVCLGLFWIQLYQVLHARLDNDICKTCV